MASTKSSATVAVQRTRIREGLREFSAFERILEVGATTDTTLSVMKVRMNTKELNTLLPQPSGRRLPWRSAYLKVSGRLAIMSCPVLGSTMATYPSRRSDA